MSEDLKSLRIDKSLKAGHRDPSPWAVRWIVGGILLFLLLGAGRFTYEQLNRKIAVRTVRAVNLSAQAGSADSGPVTLNATGYIIAAHKIELASKVLGRVSWIGVEKGDRVRRGQMIVRLEDDEYRAQLQQAQGALASLDARFAELRNGSRPEEVAVAKANLERSKAELVNAKVNLDRTRQLVEAKVSPIQNYDDAKARHDAQVAAVASLDKTYELVRIGPRQEVIDQVAGQILQAKGQVAYFRTQLDNTVIKAPIDGTILERAVEVGEFVTTSFVGERGAKGYVVSLADLKDLQVELDISQNDFARLQSKQRGIITTDAYPDRKYEGFIEEVSPEANRQKATVQVKVKVLEPDDLMRPDMNASVAFVAEKKESAQAAGGGAVAKPVILLPATAVKNGAVFVAVDGKAVKKAVRVSGSTPQGLRIEDGLIGGEDVIDNPPDELKDGASIEVRQ
ncbi:MAG: efflux RND transporter periplasmic adaptor subunit [Bryobacteraceae bacterium]